MLRILLMGALLTLTACTSGPTIVDQSRGANVAIIEVPNNITLMNVDGNAVTLPILHSNPFQVKVPVGQRQLQYYFTETFGSKSDSELIKSEVMALTLAAKAGETYRFDYQAPKNTSMSYMPTFMEKLEIWLANTTTGEKFTGKSIGAYQMSLVKMLGSGVTTNTAVSDISEGGNAGERDRLTALKQLWQGASKDERRAFMNWMIAPN